MKRRRAPTEEERALFREAVAGAKPIVPDKVHHEPPPPPAKPIQRWKDEAAALTESLSPEPLDLRLEGGDEPAFMRPGLARTVLRDLRRGDTLTLETPRGPHEFTVAAMQVVD